MKFGDRLSCDPDSLANERSYWQHLSRQGFSEGDVVYRYFAGEVFHDSPVSVESFDVPESRLCLVLQNRYALNLVARQWQDRPVSFELFSTRITFEGVRLFKASLGTIGRGVVYHSSEIFRVGDGFYIDIFTTGGLEFGSLTIRCDSVTVEDIVPKLREYYPGFSEADITIANAPPSEVWPLIERNLRGIIWGGSDKGPQLDNR
jgi:hypothetical protein